MAFQSVPNTVQCTVYHAGVSQIAVAEAQWSVYTSGPGNISQSDCETIADALEAWLNSDYDTILSEDWRVNRIVVKDLEVEGGPSVDRVLDIAGLLVGDPPPPNCAMYFKFSGTGGGSPLRGGCFWPVGSEAKLDGSNWLAAFRTECETAMDNLIANVLDSLFVGQTHTIVSRYASLNDDVKDARAALRAAIAATRRATGTTNTVASYTLRAEVASQRDRRPSA